VLVVSLSRVVVVLIYLPEPPKEKKQVVLSHTPFIEVLCGRIALSEKGSPVLGALMQFFPDVGVEMQSCVHIHFAASKSIQQSNEVKPLEIAVAEAVSSFRYREAHQSAVGQYRACATTASRIKALSAQDYSGRNHCWCFTFGRNFQRPSLI